MHTCSGSSSCDLIWAVPLSCPPYEILMHACWLCNYFRAPCFTLIIGVQVYAYSVQDRDITKTVFPVNSGRINMMSQQLLISFYHRTTDKKALYRVTVSYKDCMNHYEQTAGCSWGYLHVSLPAENMLHTERLIPPRLLAAWMCEHFRSIKARTTRSKNSTYLCQLHYRTECCPVINTLWSMIMFDLTSSATWLYLFSRFILSHKVFF